MPVIDHFKLRVGASAVRAVYHGDVVLSESTLDLDFLIQRYVRMTAGKNFADILTFTRASAATQINALGVLESVAANVPRLDYDPVTLQPKGILIEEQRTNVAINSVFSGFTAGTPGVAPAPWVMSSADGSLNIYSNAVANILRFAAVSGRQKIYQLFAVTSGSTWTASIDVDVHVSCSVQNAFDLGTISYSSDQYTVDGVAVAGSYSLPLGRHKIEHTKTFSDAGSASIGFGIGYNVATTGDISFSALNVEQGVYKTSYIPTTTAQVTRAADVCSINTLSPWWNPVEGTIYCEFAIGNVGVGIRVPFGFGLDTLADGRCLAYTSGASITFDNYVSAVMQFSANRAGLISNNKIAFALADNNAAMVLNGGVVATDTSGLVGEKTYLKIGGSNYGITDQINGHIRKLRYFPHRLANAQLQALTA